MSARPSSAQAFVLSTARNLLIDRARRWRKMVGGGLRQSGLLAAAAHHALDHHVHRLADDHALAQRLAQGLAGIDGLSVRSAQTNIVFVDVANGRGPDLLAHLAQDGVLATGLIGLRFVTHLDVDADGIDHAVACVRAFFAQGGTAPVARAAGSATPRKVPSPPTTPHASAPWRVARLMGQPSATVRVTPAFWAASWTARTISSTPGLVRLTTSVRRRMAMNDD